MRRSILGRPYIFSSAGLQMPGWFFKGIAAALLVVVFAFGGLNEEHFPGSQDSFGYSEPAREPLPLPNYISRDETYVLISLQSKSIEIRLRGILLWSSPFAVSPEDSLVIFRVATDSSFGVGRVTDRHLYQAALQYGDSLLDIIAGAEEVSKDSLMRYLPESFELILDNKYILRFVSDIDGSVVSLAGSTYNGVKRWMLRVVGYGHLQLLVCPEDALTLYRLCGHGTAIAIRPVGV